MRGKKSQWGSSHGGEVRRPLKVIGDAGDTTKKKKQVVVEPISEGSGGGVSEPGTRWYGEEAKRATWRCGEVCRRRAR